ncbi:DUF2577 domain-containing protein [Clostridium botulinum]|uniref:DUF2577 family protein n=1 Tax=Clostridium botulinum TaxID=1491 RepID=UPI000773F3A9|nr:DUF2577 family protein [Clostridium botulinum]MBN3369079.1 hypothetical protein [Clostridium botulinum]MBN3376679.1 hypothetical protein [Clostridium botulinum]MBY6846797.1 DUF2577 family protein [Clostridium botulinum]NEZ72119.1 DUF2577 domain-containing protein [Clostridium botulinum]NEZ84587.1 DUF2577 domain-containing protein [Clostridium botulinum]
MDYRVEFAQWLKDRDNKPRIGTTIGIVKKAGIDYKISIVDNQLYLDKSNSKLCNSLKDRTEERIIELNNVTYNAKIIYNNVLNIGDTVLIVPDESNQFFYIIDKI